MSAFNFFQRRACLTLGPDWPTACAEFERVGLTDVWRFNALPIDGKRILGPHQSFSASVRQILQDFMVSGAASLLHLEDDVVFRDCDHLQQALAELPSNWDIVYLGANLLCWNQENDPQPERYSEHLFKVRQAWTTHAIGFNRKCVQTLLDHQPDFSEQMFDQFLSESLTSLNAFVVAPMVAYQRPHKSSIWQQNEWDDYADIFDASNAKLV